MKKDARDLPFVEIADQMQRHMLDGWDVFQKFTCANCGQRLTMAEPNMMWKEGDCDQCGHVTDIVKQGCGYSVVTPGVYERSKQTRGKN